MSDPLMRVITMLRLIPRAPKSIGTKELLEKLEAAGFKITQRSIQRNLKTLTDELGLECFRGTKPYGWRWPQHGPVFEVPVMDPATALTLKLSSEFLRRLLPREIADRLGGHVARAEKVLEGIPHSKLASWPKKIRVTSAGLPVRHPATPAPVFDVVTRALLQDQRFKCKYQRRDGDVREYEVSPIALVYRDAFPYLACLLNKHEEGVVTIVPHRIQSAELLPGARRVPKDFNLDEFVRAGGTGFLIDRKPLQLVALVDAMAAPTVAELPIADDQTLEPHDEDRLLLRASVPHSLELQRWLLGFGDAIEVLGPEHVREQMRAISENLAARYTRASGVQPAKWNDTAAFRHKGHRWGAG